jgi:hypothetical protein
VLELAEAYATDCKPGEWNTVRSRLAIIPSKTGKLLTASQVVLAPEGTTFPGRGTVASALYNDANARRILADVMKVQAPDDNVWEQVLSESMRSIPYYSGLEARDRGWRSFWVRLRQSPVSARDRFVRQHRDEIRIRRRDGAWAMADEVLLPGALIESNDISANQNILVDEAVHSGDGTTLATIGVSEIPEGYIGPDAYYKIKDTYVLSEWLDACRTTYRSTHKNSASRDYLEPSAIAPLGRRSPLWPEPCRVAPIALDGIA